MEKEVMSEDRLCSLAMQWLWNTYPETRRCFFHVPNELAPVRGESKQSHMQRLMKAKAMGVVSGVHDIIYYWAGQGGSIELKVGKNRMSEEQVKFGDAWEAQGAKKWPACYTIEEFQSIIKQILGK